MYSRIAIVILVIAGVGCTKARADAYCAEKEDAVACNASGKYRCYPEWKKDTVEPDSFKVDSLAARCDPGCTEAEADKVRCHFFTSADGTTECQRNDRQPDPACGVRKTRWGGDVCTDIVSRCNGCRAVFDKCVAGNPCSGVICL